MKNHKGEGISFGMTASGVMVQVQHGQASDDEWVRLIEAVRGEANALIGIVVLAESGKGPDARQRKQFAALVDLFTKSFRGVALLTDSTVIRGALTAIRWLNPRGPAPLPFALSDIEGALNCLKLSADQKFEVRSLLKSLERVGARAAG